MELVMGLTRDRPGTMKHHLWSESSRVERLSLHFGGDDIE